jgi:hypothetical protein
MTITAVCFIVGDWDEYLDIGEQAVSSACPVMALVGTSRCQIYMKSCEFDGVFTGFAM